MRRMDDGTDSGEASFHPDILYPRPFLPPQEPKLLACASLAIFTYYSSGLRGSFTTSSLYLATIHSYYPSGLRGSFILPLIYVIPTYHRLVPMGVASTPVN
jgi:hypothetical protein